jgi:hypothetical protein
MENNPPLTGTAEQIAWALQIRTRVNAEFDRVAKGLEGTAAKRSGSNQKNTYTMISILEEKRAEVMANPDAGYFIHDWQEMYDQVRKLMIKDARYQAIKASI